MSEFSEILTQCFELHRDKLGSNNTLFLKRVFDGGLEKYERRVQALGFQDCGSVLDAGCGFGQWTLALSRHNASVSACDLSAERVAFLADLADALNVDTIDLKVSGLEQLPYSSCTFDAVFCYGVLFLTPWRETLLEINRVLKPGGKLYVNANGLGWYVYLWDKNHNKADDYDPKQAAADTLADTLAYDRDGIYRPGSSVIIEPESLKEELTLLGFQDILVGGEGRLHVNKAVELPTPFFQERYYDLTGVYEAVGTKGGESKTA